jgi:hypothetical protein
MAFCHFLHFSCYTVDRVFADRNHHVSADCSRFAIGISASLAPFVSSFQTTPCGRALLVLLDGPDNGLLGFRKIYTSNDSLS